MANCHSYVTLTRHSCTLLSPVLHGWRPSGANLLSGEACFPTTSSEVAATRGPAATKGSFLADTDRELSVALIKCQGSVYRGCANLMARATGRQVSPGAEVPYED